MPQGTFQGAGVKTVVLFFEKGAPTRKIWSTILDPGRSLGKTTALNDADLEEFVRLPNSFEDSDNSWSMDAEIIHAATYDLSVMNPNKAEEAALRDPLGDPGRNRGARCRERGDFGPDQGAVVKGWEITKLGEICAFDKSPHKGGSLPYVGMENIESGNGAIVGALSQSEVRVPRSNFRLITFYTGGCVPI